MAAQEASPAPSAQVVGHAFVEQYYHILHQSPELVHRFYQDSSFLSRPDDNGGISTITTMQAINEKILSLNYGEYTAEIETADAQDSYGKGVIVLVTGSLTGKDNVRKKFTQTFFLAPQDKGYFVLNDIFRYLEEKEPVQNRSLPVNNVSQEASIPAQTVEPELVHDHHEPEPVASIDDEQDNTPEVYDPSDKDDGSVVEDEIVEPPAQSHQNQAPPGAEWAPVSQEEGQKKSYASILKAIGSNMTAPPSAPVQKARPAPANINQNRFSSAKPVTTPEASVPSADNVPESANVDGESEGHSIFVRNLPFDATPAQLEEVFKKFGAIKHDGIQVRSNKQGFCFGFVEFETLIAKQSALEASHIAIGERQAVVEEKRTNTRVTSSSGRGRYPSGRSSFRSDSFKGRGGYGGGRGYGRGEFRGQGEFPGRPRGSGARNGEGYQRLNQNGTGRAGRTGVGYRSSTE